MFFIIDLNVLLDKNHFKWTPLNCVSNQKYNSPNKKKKWFL